MYTPQAAPRQKTTPGRDVGELGSRRQLHDGAADHLGGRRGDDPGDS